MKSGSELDKLIAEKVMGWTKQPKIRYGMWKGETTEHQEELWIAPGWTTKQAYTQDLAQPPCFSTDISEALLVLKILHKYGRVITIKSHRDGTIDLHGIEGNQYDTKFQVTSDSIPHAICLAALKALEIK